MIPRRPTRVKKKNLKYADYSTQPLDDKSDSFPYTISSDRNSIAQTFDAQSEADMKKLQIESKMSGELIFETSLPPVLIHRNHVGFNAIAKQNIKKGTQISTYLGERGKVKIYTPEEQAYVIRCGLRKEDSDEVIFSHKTGSVARFFNHSYTVDNVEACIDSHKNIIYIAKRNIEKGEALLLNYSKDYHFKRFSYLSVYHNAMTRAELFKNYQTFYSQYLLPLDDNLKKVLNIEGYAGSSLIVPKLYNNRKINLPILLGELTGKHLLIYENQPYLNILMLTVAVKDFKKMKYILRTGIDLLAETEEGVSVMSIAGNQCQNEDDYVNFLPLFKAIKIYITQFEDSLPFTFYSYVEKCIKNEDLINFINTKLDCHFPEKRATILSETLTLDKTKLLDESISQQEKPQSGLSDQNQTPISDNKFMIASKNKELIDLTISDQFYPTSAMQSPSVSVIPPMNKFMDRMDSQLSPDRFFTDTTTRKKDVRKSNTELRRKPKKIKTDGQQEQKKQKPNILLENYGHLTSIGQFENLFASQKFQNLFIKNYRLLFNSTYRQLKNITKVYGIILDMFTDSFQIGKIIQQGVLNSSQLDVVINKNNKASNITYLRCALACLQTFPAAALPQNESILSTLRTKGIAIQLKSKPRIQKTRKQKPSSSPDFFKKMFGFEVPPLPPVPTEVEAPSSSIPMMPDPILTQSQAPETSVDTQIGSLPFPEISQTGLSFFHPSSTQNPSVPTLNNNDLLLLAINSFLR